MNKKLLALFLGLVFIATSCGAADDAVEAAEDAADDAAEAVEDAADDAADAAEDAAEEVADAVSGDADRAVVIPTHNWSSQLVSAEVVGRTLQEAGYEVEYVPSDSQAVYAAMCEGDVDLVHEVWEGAFGVAYEEQVDAGCVVEAHTHNAVTREEWWYPTYVEDVCPGLPDWEALNACADLFATAETGDRGRFLGGPVDWLKGDEERVEGLGMDFEVVNAGSAATLWAELDAASATNTPIVLFNWTPNFVEAVYDGKFIEFPEFEPDCRTDPAWGINPDLTHDCGNPANGYLKTGVSTKFIDEMPGAYAIVQNIDLTNEMLAAMAAMVDVDGMDAVDAAEKWMADNDATWRAWLG